MSKFWCSPLNLLLEEVLQKPLALRHLTGAERFICLARQPEVLMRRRMDDPDRRRFVKIISEVVAT